MPIRWTELEPGSYEDLVAILLGILHPDIERVDGSGGDEGRDLFYQDAENLEIYQLKSYKDRLTSAQRSKVRKDLERAATHDPTAWILVVPIDPTPGERSWFDGLRETVSFPIHWRGLNWLEARMAENPQLVRYVSSDTNAEVIDLLKELREEEAALETAADAAPRVRRLVDRLNELDPYFTFRVESDGQITKLTATQRYADAVRDAQLGGTFSVTGDEAAHLLRGAVDYGLPAEFTAEHDVTVTMRAPGGLSYEGPVEHLAFLSTPPEDDLPGVLRLLDGNVTISELPVLITPVSSGRRGGVLSGRDRAGVLMFEMRFDTEERTVTFNSSTSVPDRGALPGDFLPALTLMRAADIGMTLVVALTGDDGTLRELFKLTMEDRWIPHPEGIDLVSSLDRIQRASGQYFDLSEEFTAGDQFWIKAADRLLAGASVQVPWTEQTVDVTIVPDGREGLLRSLDQGKGRIQLRIGQQINVPIAGRVIRLGAGEAHIRGAVVANADEVRTAVDAAPPGELVSTELKLIPTEDHPPITLRMKQEPAPDGHGET